MIVQKWPLMSLFCLHLKFRSLVLIQVCFQQLLSHLNFSLESIWVLICLTWFK